MNGITFLPLKTQNSDTISGGLKISHAPIQVSNEKLRIPTRSIWWPKLKLANRCQKISHAPTKVPDNNVIIHHLGKLVFSKYY